MHNILRSPLYEDSYKPTFSGHETFTLRYGWLKKAYDAVVSLPDDATGRDLFTDDSAIAIFGVGKNMVTSIRHWATSSGIIADAGKGRIRTTPLGDFIFGERGVDPYLESPATLWLLHWQLAGYHPEDARPNKTTWHWVINHFPGLSFDRDELIEGLAKIGEARKWSRLAPATIRNDVDCFVRTYESRHIERDNIEDAISCPLAELGLIRGRHRRYQLIRGAKPSLPNEVFVYALERFWRRFGANRTLSFETIAHEPGAPGRVFLLDEADLDERLIGLEDTSGGAFRWSETAGLKQVLRNRSLTDADLITIVKGCYTRRLAKEAA